ncbi:membrane protein [Burkholderia arboris]|uniref:Membrane protein n=1 Tax=Burkholderia arboris TaxID=488730 RepID=A0A9Q9SPG1_9BURK|nr:hypothetical protein [Burkholderia arboris]VWC27507.1 membrane protein [Burkholderia arboris]
MNARPPLARAKWPIGCAVASIANVDYATTLTNGATVFEKPSFRLEGDGRWRLTGYVSRQSQNFAQ